MSTINSSAVRRHADHQERRDRFRWHQIELAIVAGVWSFGFLATGYTWFAAGIVLAACAGAIEAHRFRLTGRHYETHARRIPANRWLDLLKGDAT